MSHIIGTHHKDVLGKPFSLLKKISDINWWPKGRQNASPCNTMAKTGEVYLVGAGPGDAELMTVKGFRLLQQADVVLYDWLISADIIDMIPAATEKVFVGKKCGHHSMTQEHICQLMIEYALQGKCVIRLKGGDPAIFARAAEECEALRAFQIPFAIVPGVTAASGASAYSGIFLTHRECAQSVRFVTAHLKNDEGQTDWRSVVKSAQNKDETLVIYMGLGRLASIMDEMQRHGLCHSTPVAVIDQATTAQQKIAVSTAKEIAATVVDQAFSGPALIVVGQVVNKRVPADLALLAERSRVNSHHG